MEYLVIILLLFINIANGSDLTYPSNKRKYRTCEIGKRYCDQELEIYNFQQIYECLGPNRVELLHSCVGLEVCERGPLGDPQCIANWHCNNGSLHCGSKLLSLSEVLPPKIVWSVEASRVYQCVHTETHIELRLNHTCFGDCMTIGVDSYCVQKCDSNLLYCGYELNRLEGWKKFPPNTLYRCNNSYGIEFVQNCNSTCTAYSKNSYCNAAANDKTKICGVKKGDNWPWIASVQDSFTGQHINDGVLISDQWVVMAAHSFIRDYSQIQVSLGSNISGRFEKGQVKVSVDKIVVHPNYKLSWQVSENDLILMHLETPIVPNDLINPICLADLTANLTSECKLIGWGGATNVPTVLQAVDKRLSTSEKCRNYLNEAGSVANYDESKMICTVQTGGQLPCHSDNGSLLMCKSDKGQWILAGLSSYASCRQSTTIELVDFYTRLSYCHDWIRNITNA